MANKRFSKQVSSTVYSEIMTIETVKQVYGDHRAEIGTYRDTTELLHCALAAQCIVIGPVCVCGGRAVSVTTITRNCVHRFSPNWVCW